MRHFGRSLTFAGFTALYTYLVMLGGTYGLLIASTRLLSLAAVAIVAVVWLVVRWRGGWPWPRTTLDGPALLWLGAIGLSLLLNPAPWRRELIGVWFVLLYLGVWYVLSDLVARGVFRRDRLMELVPLGGFIVVVIGLFQSRVWLLSDLPRMLTGTAPLGLPRPGSTLGNPNTLAGILVVLVPFALALGLRGRGLARWLAWTLAGVSTLLMVLTYSRGGWLGLMAAYAVFGWLLLLDRNLIHPDAFWRWWGRQSQSVRAGMVTTLLVGVLLVVAVLVVGLVSLGQGGRGLNLRTYIYSAAINLFAGQPVAGHGLFTFGQGLSEQVSTPPWQTHSHAHNMILHVAAEMGIAGLIALLATLLAVARATRANWRAASSNERILLAGAFAAVAGFVVHHQLDFPAMVPAVALTGLIALVAACTPVGAGEASGVFRQRFSLGLVAVLWAAVLVSGFWSTAVYTDYSDALNLGVGQRAYGQAADQMQTAIDRDPALAVQYYQQGFLYGLAAENGDNAALHPAIEDFRQYVALEPAYPTGWANLSALLAEQGDAAGAADAMRSAFAAAPDLWTFQYLLGRAEERVGNTGAARAIYHFALNAVPDLPLYPDWPGSPLRDELAAATDRTPAAQTALLLEAGQVAQARALWDATTSEDRGGGYDALAVDIWLTIAEGDTETAAAALDALTGWEATRESQAWLHFLEAQLAAASGDPAKAADALAAARQAITLGPFDVDDPDLANIHYIQYLQAAIARTYLPQVGYPLAGPLIIHLLADRS